MTLDKHLLDSVPRISAKIEAGYIKIGTAPAQGYRLKAWWNHPTYKRVEVIYSSDGAIAITAYHVN